MVICYDGGTDILGLVYSVGAGGIRGAEDVGDVGNEEVTTGASDGAIWGPSVSVAGGG